LELSLKTEIFSTFASANLKLALKKKIALDRLAMIASILLKFKQKLHCESCPQLSPCWSSRNNGSSNFVFIRFR